MVLVNHALYFADLGLRRVSDGAVSILPDHDAVIFDEAHELEDAAAEWLGARLGMVDLMLLARDVERACIRDGAPEAAPGRCTTLERDGAVLFGSLEVPGGGRRRLREADLRALPPQALAGLRGALGAIASALGGAGEECDLVSRRAERLGFALEACVHADLDETVVWSERTGPGSAGLRSAPIDVGPLLREALWDELGAAVLHLGHARGRRRPRLHPPAPRHPQRRASSSWPRPSTPPSRRCSTCRATRPTRAPRAGRSRSPASSSRSCARRAGARSASSRAGARSSRCTRWPRRR